MYNTCISILNNVFLGGRCAFTYMLVYIFQKYKAERSFQQQEIITERNCTESCHATKEL